jgi:hypothetical protein
MPPIVNVLPGYSGIVKCLPTTFPPICSANLESIMQYSGRDKVSFAFPINIFCGKISKKQLSAIKTLASMLF